MLSEGLAMGIVRKRGFSSMPKATPSYEKLKSESLLRQIARANGGKFEAQGSRVSRPKPEQKIECLITAAQIVSDAPMHEMLLGGWIASRLRKVGIPAKGLLLFHWRQKRNAVRNAGVERGFEVCLSWINRHAKGSNQRRGEHHG